MRFRFEIRQYFAVSNQFLYLHCTVTLCKRNDVPPSSAFRCSWRKREVVRRSCPHKQEENVVTGPFTVWPDWLKQDHRTTQVGFNSKCRAVGTKKLYRKARLRTEFLSSVITSVRFLLFCCYPTKARGTLIRFALVPNRVSETNTQVRFAVVY